MNLWCSMAIFWRTVWCEVKVPALTGISFPTWFFCWNLCSHIGSFSCLATRWARGIQSSFVLLCISVHISTASSWYMVSFSHSPSSVLPPPLLFFFHRGSRWRLLLVIFPFIKDLLDILSSGSVWGKCDLARKMAIGQVQPGAVSFAFCFCYCRTDLHKSVTSQKKNDILWSRWRDMFMSHKKNTKKKTNPKHFSGFPFYFNIVHYFLLLICC